MRPHRDRFQLGIEWRVDSLLLRIHYICELQASATIKHWFIYILHKANDIGHSEPVKITGFEVDLAPPTICVHISYSPEESDAWFEQNIS